MKTALFASFVLMLAPKATSAQTNDDIIDIEVVVQAFAAAGDLQDAQALEQILHPYYRSVVHRVMGSPDTKVLDKATYVQLMRDKKIGGDKRTVKILHTEVEQNTAVVKAVLTGQTLKFTTFLSLVRLPEGGWQIVSDMPQVN